jgi:sodium-dependent phosphate cotransporter
MTLVAVALLLTALLLLVKVLRSLVLKRAESFFDRVLFRNAGTAFVVGLVLTASVQSSSVTTSLAVPLIAAGLLTLDQVFPYLLGANIGTTVTALLAAFATSAQTEAQARVGLTLACAHLLFNVIGAIIFYPLRRIPIAMARALARKAAESRRYAVIFVLGVFFGVPLVGIAAYSLLTRMFGG